MATSNLKSTAITALDSSPPGAVVAGQGGTARLLCVEGFVTANSGDAVGSTYQLVRVPTTACVKEVKLYAACASAGAADMNIAFSDSTVDGTTPSNQGTIPQISSANNKLFGSAVSLIGGLASPVELTYDNATNYPVGSEQQPLWQVLGFTSDPGGFFDLKAVVTTAVTTGGVVLARVYYTIGG